MRRTSVLVTIALLAGLGSSLLIRSAYEGMLRQKTHAADLAAIEKLHQEDIQATLTQDPRLLINLWSNDCVKLGVPGPAIVGKTAMQAVYENFRAKYPDFHVLKYAPQVQDLQIVDGWAIEWVYYDTTFKLSGKDSPVGMRRKDLRVLKRQRDGTWKFARDAESD